MEMAPNPDFKIKSNIISTTDDLIKYIRLQLDTTNHVIVKSQKPLFNIEGNEYTAYLWNVTPDDPEEGTYWGHHGGSYGANCWIFVLPERNLGIVATCNQSSATVSRNLLRVINMIIEEPIFKRGVCSQLGEIREVKD